jgi:hypothetical protein
MATPVSIVNAARLELGADAIANVDDDAIAALLWPMVRDEIIRSHPWNCCIKRQALTPDNTSPASEYSYQFTLPADCLRVLDVDGADRDWKIEGTAILCNASTVTLRYVFREEDPQNYDASLVEVMTAAMRYRMAYPLTHSSTQVDMMYKLFINKLSEAKGIDAQEDTPDMVGDSPLLAVRG